MRSPAALMGTSTNRLTYVGHATVLIELGGVRLLTDPVLRASIGHLRRHGPVPAPEVSEKLDAVLVSHLHLDHLDLPSLRRIDRGVRLLVPRGAGALARKAGFAHAEELVAGDSVRVEGLEIVATDAVHDDRRRPMGVTRADAIGFVLRGERSIYFAGDTDLFDDMAQLEPDLDVALLPIWGWGPSLGPGHLDPGGAARAAAMLRPRIAVPIHWGTFYPRGLRAGERLTGPPQEFGAQLARLAPDVEVHVLNPGQSLTLPA